MRQVPEDDQSVGTAVSIGHSFHKDFPEKGSKCNLFDEHDNKSLRRQSAIYHVSIITFFRLLYSFIWFEAILTENFLRLIEVFVWILFAHAFHF